MWRTKQGKHLKLPEEIKKMLKVAEKYKIKIQARKTNMKLKGDMIAWLNIMKPKSNYKQNKRASKCL